MEKKKGEERDTVELLLDINCTIMIEIYTMDPTNVIKTNAKEKSKKNEKVSRKRAIF